MNIPGSTVKDKVKLTKIESIHNNLRTNEVIGYCWNLPTVGERFMIWEEPKFENVVIREVITTTIKEVEQIYEKIWEFKTQNSTYYLELV